MREDRLPPRWVLASYLGHLPSIVGLVAAGVVATLNPGIWPGPAAWWVLGPLLLLRLIDPWYELASFRLSADADRLTLRTGILQHRTRSIRWADAGTVTVDAPWNLRVLGLVSMTVAQGGSDATRLELPALAPDRRALLEGHLASRGVGIDVDERAGSATETPDARQDEAFEEATGGILVHRASIGELAIASLVLGRFVLAGAGLAFAAWELLGTLGLTEAALRTGSSSIALAAAAAVGVLLLGVPATVVRYWGLEVRTLPDGGLRLSHGLLAHRDRRVDPGAVVGIEVRRNIVEMLLGRARLGLLTADSASQLGTNLLLPSLPLATVRDVLGRLPQRRLAGLAISDRPAVGAAVVQLLLLLVGTAGAGAVAALLGARPWVAALVALATLGGAWLVGIVLRTRIDVDEATHAAAGTTELAGERRRALDPGAVHVVRQLGPAGRGGITRLVFYAGRARALHAARISVSDLQRLQMLAVRAAPVAAARRAAIGR